jgi:hypothetical protein
MWRGDGRSDRAVTPVLSTLFMIALALVVGIVVVVGALTFLPEDTEPRPRADFTIDRSSEAFRIVPQYMEDGTEFVLQIDGQDVYTWQGSGGREVRRLSCLVPGDELSIRSVHDGGGRTYLIERYTVEARTNCDLSGTATQFAYAKVGDREVPLRDQSFEFTLSIDPDGPNSVNGDTSYPTTNPWVYVQRFDRPVEGLEPPVYVVVFPDNVGDWDSSPSSPDRARIADSVTVTASGDLQATPGGSEPTNDVYLVFQPGCEESTFQYVTKQASYENVILLNGEPLFTATGGSATYTGPGVTCTN